MSKQIIEIGAVRVVLEGTLTGFSAVLLVPGVLVADPAPSWAISVARRLSVFEGLDYIVMGEVHLIAGKSYCKTRPYARSLIASALHAPSTSLKTFAHVSAISACMTAPDEESLVRGVIYSCRSLATTNSVQEAFFNTVQDGMAYGSTAWVGVLRNAADQILRANSARSDNLKQLAG